MSQGSRLPAVLLALLFQHVGDVIVGDAPDKTPFGIHHRDRRQVVLLYQVGHVLLVHIHRDAHHLGTHEILHVARRWCEQEVAEGEQPGKATPLVHHVDVVDRFGLLHRLSDGLDRFGDTGALGNGHELCRHEPARRVLLVDQEFLDLLPVFLRNVLQDLLYPLLGEVGHHVGGVVRFHRLHQRGDVVRRDLLHHGRAGRIFHLGQGIRGGLFVEQAQYLRRFVGFEHVENVGDVGGVEAGHEVQDEPPRSLPLPQQVMQGGDELPLVLFQTLKAAAHGVSPRWW